MRVGEGAIATGQGRSKITAGQNFNVASSFN